MKTNSLFKIVLLFFLILLFSCEQEDVLQLEEAKVEEVIEEQEPAGELDYVTEASIPEIIEEISIRAVNGEAKKFAGKIRYNDVNIDLTSIIRVRKNGVVNYTFALDVKNASEHNIYNLVIGRDSKGRKKQPFIIGYEMEPQDMKAFFDSGEDFSKFKTNYRYYTFASFFADSKSGKVGKNGDCGGGATGGGTNGGAETNPGSTFTIGRGRQTVSSTFSNTRVGIPYGYSIRINDGTPAQASTTAISSGIQITTPQVPNAPVYSYRVPSGTTSVNASATGNGGSGSCLTVTFGLDGQINISSDCSNDKVKKSLTAKGDCPDGDGAIGINTASKPAQKIFYYLDSSLSKPEIDWLNDGRNYSTAVGLMNYLKNNRSSQDKAFAKEAISFSMKKPLNIQTTRAQLISEIRIYTNSIAKFGNKNEKELAKFLSNINSSFSDFSNSELYSYYKTTRELRLKMQLNRIATIVLAVAESFQPVIELVLWEVGGGLALKILTKLPARLITVPVSKVISRLKGSNSTAFTNFKYAKIYGINTYSELAASFEKLGIKRLIKKVEFHHIIEQRFVNIVGNKLGTNTNKWKSIVLTKGKNGEHQKFTNEWLKAIGRDGQKAGWTGKTTSTATYADVKRAAEVVYKDYPEILKQIGL